MHECYILIQPIFLYIVSLVAPSQPRMPSHKEYGKMQGSVWVQWGASVFQQDSLFCELFFLTAGFTLENFNSPLWNVSLNVDKYGNISFKTYNTARNFMSSIFFSTPAAVTPVLGPSSSFINLKACNKYVYSLYTASTPASKLSHLVLTAIFTFSLRDICCA